jgi:5,10-methylene-tetrahydrofolate dehydrogenase/methenyl tetrahydrofolate cyclohydrolase
MPAQLIDGVQLSQQLRAEIAARAAALTAAGQQPGLAVILVGEDPASQVYVRNKVKACGDVGFHSVLEKYEADLSEAALLARIAALNADPAIHGILVQMPLPKHIDPHKVIEAISPAKDVDGYSVLSAGELVPTCRASALHALRLHEADRKHRHRPARQARGRDRPQQHGRQADGAAALASERHRDHMP